IGDISIKMQAKLLRVIEEREIMKIGGDRIIPIDVRIIAATNRDLKQMIYEKTFRKDLYYRLREGYIHLPS
ncbi:sigma-54 factor interaction domain-containing protein, partial [Desulfovibrio desulfuricans]|nr:sigma-54 factor interaction domain-containing protein [Desulfovibrio desulfuricans]